LNRKFLLLPFAVAAFVSCTTTTPMPSAIAPQGDDRFLADPRLGFPAADVQTDERLEAAWRHFLAGQYDQARRRLTELRTRMPDYAPADLLLAAIDLREGRADVARNSINTIADQYPNYTAARVYQAEVALAEGNTRRGWEIYRSLAALPDAPPTAADRLATAERRLFEELVTAARNADETASIPLLREALTINPNATEARLMLVERLVQRKQWDEARRIVQPLVDSADADRDDVQEALAEIEVGRGRFQEAINRYERLARRSTDPRYSRRLAEIKEEWTLANMPAQYRNALNTESITRADLAVLIYWTLSNVRFAQNLGSPPIAIDVAEVPGREEVVRAIAIGLYDVDPVTRRISPFRIVTASTLARHAARLLAISRAPCATGENVLASCGVTDPTTTLMPDSPVSGRTAATIVEQIDRAVKGR
jgi:tetratricopeptide (TPR) repeat protein